MKTHSNDFKNNIKQYGKQIDSKITYQLNGETIELGKVDLNSITPHYQANILKSVMKQLDLDSNVDIPLGTVVNYKFGLKVNGEYEYLNFGNYIVYSSEKQEDTKSYKIICYDKMLYSMKPYESFVQEYPISINDYIDKLCQKLGLIFKSKNDSYANKDKIIQSELYLDSEGNDLGYTYRDVFDELAQVTASTIVINEETDELEIRYINDTQDTIDEEFLKSVNVTFGEKYGPINSVVLSRAAESDNVYLQDETSITQNGLCEIKIIDNQIMNWNDRNTYLPDILAKLNGLEYYINYYESFGIVYYNVCDKYNVKIGENTYSCIMFNDVIDVTKGLGEKIYCDMPDDSQTDYTKADKTDRRINKTYLIVDKQNQKIESVITNVGKQDEKISSLTQTVDKLETKVSNVLVINDIEEGKMRLNITNATEGVLYKFTIHGRFEVPITNEDLYVSEQLIVGDNIIRLIQGDTILQEFELPLMVLNRLGTIYDEFICLEGKCTIVRRIGINEDGTMYELENEIIENYPDMVLLIPEGDSVIEMDNASDMTCEYMIKNQYTDKFATKVELNSAIIQTTENINLNVNNKLSNYSTTTEMNSAIDIKANSITSQVSQTYATKNELNSEVSTINQTTNNISLEVSKKVGNNEIISKINQSAEQVEINANKISLAGKEINLTSEDVTITSSKLQIDKQGNIKSQRILVEDGYLFVKTVPSQIIGATIGGIVVGDYAGEDVKPVPDAVSLTNHGVLLKDEDVETFLGIRSILLDDNTNSSMWFPDLFYISHDNNNADAEINITQKDSPYQSSSMKSTGVWSPAFNNNSLESKKKNIVLDDGCLQQILDTDIVSFNWNFEDDTDKKHIGMIIPDLGGNYKYSQKALTHDRDAVDLYSMTGMSWKAIQELYGIIELQKEKIEELEEKLNGTTKSN